jgi:hypothetical protein
VSLPFWISIASLSIVQGVLVLLPSAPEGLRMERMGGRLWALVPPVSVLGFVVVVGAAERASAQGLTYLALVCVPVLAAIALGWLCRGARPGLAALAVALFALAWAARGSLAGDTAALALSGLSCVTLGVLLAAVTPPRWLAAGIVAMALADTALVVSDLLQRPNNALNAAHPAAGLPRLQSAVFGSAVMGYGDLFVAAVLGALLARALGGAAQRRAAVFTAALALSFDLLFFTVHELPATVPVALALILSGAWRRLPAAGAGRRARARDRRPAAVPGAPALGRARAR